MTITCDPSCTWPDVAMAFVVVLNESLANYFSIYGCPPSCECEGGDG